MQRPSLLKLSVWLVLLVLAGVVIYKFELAPMPVVAHQVAKGEIVGEVMGTGTLEARVKTTVSVRIQEQLTEVAADQGDAVKKGQLLARLDDATSRHQVAIAQAALESARQTAARVRADLARAEAVLAQARLDDKRYKGLAGSQAVAQSEAEKAAENLRIAEADLTRSHAAIAEADSDVLVAEKNLLFRQDQLAFTQILAPYDGLVIRRDRDPGDVPMPGASLMQLISLDEIWVSAWVDETAMAALAVGQPARIVFRSEPGRGYPGTVARLGRETDRETREFIVDVRVKELPKNWTVGQRAEVYIETGRQADAVLLPSVFLFRNQGRPGVFVDRAGRARWQEISPGLSGGALVAAAKGLDAGAIVVRPPDGSPKPLQEGQRIAHRP